MNSCRLYLSIFSFSFQFRLWFFSISEKKRKKKNRKIVPRINQEWPRQDRYEEIRRNHDAVYIISMKTARYRDRLSIGASLSATRTNKLHFRPVVRHCPNSRFRETVSCGSVSFLRDTSPAGNTETPISARLISRSKPSDTCDTFSRFLLRSSAIAASPGDWPREIKRTRRYIRFRRSPVELSHRKLKYRKHARAQSNAPDANRRLASYGAAILSRFCSLIERFPRGLDIVAFYCGNLHVLFPSIDAFNARRSSTCALKETCFQTEYRFQTVVADEKISVVFFLFKIIKSVVTPCPF